MQGEVLGTSTQVGYVTQDQLTAEISDLRSLIYQLAASTTTAFTDPQIAANGDGVYFGGVAAPVTQISGSAITSLTASEIPDLSGTYLPLSGGTVTGTTTFSGGIGGPNNFIVQQPSGNVGIGTSNPQYPLDVEFLGSNDLNLQSDTGAAGVQINSYRNSSITHAEVGALAARGTASAPLAVQAGDALLSLRGDGYGTTQFDDFNDDSAAIDLDAAENFTDSAAGGKIVFWTRSNGTIGFKSVRMVIQNNGNVGIGGNQNPYSRLQVNGPDAASSTLAFNVVNSASSTVFAVFDGGNAQLSGTLTQSSDQRLKTNVQSLDASSSLSLIDELNPVTFTWINPDEGSTPQLGFIAQQVQEIFPNLVATTSATALTPDGTLGLNYTGLISPIVSAIQSIANVTGTFEQSLIAWLANAQNGIGDLFAQRIHTTEICIGDTNTDPSPICLTKEQLAAILTASNQSPSPSDANQSQTAAPQGQSAASSTSESVTQNDRDASASTTPPDTAPVIQINGDNPAIIQVGATYSDLGATVTGPSGDLNLDIETFLNGSPISPIEIDTSQPATDTIDYVITDQYGLTATSTRTVIIEPPAAATSTAQ